MNIHFIDNGFSLPLKHHVHHPLAFSQKPVEVGLRKGKISLAAVVAAVNLHSVAQTQLRYMVCHRGVLVDLTQLNYRVHVPAVFYVQMKGQSIKPELLWTL
jgi:hypothetical protein